MTTEQTITITLSRDDASYLTRELDTAILTHEKTRGPASMIERTKQIQQQILDLLETTAPRPVMQTITILIGNSDNKLTQLMWSKYVARTNWHIERHAHAVHFKGGSSWDSQWQNACWVCEIAPDRLEQIRKEITEVRTQHFQDSVAIIVGNTEFI